MPKAGYVPWHETVMTELTSLVSSAMEMARAPHVASEDCLLEHLYKAQFARKMLEQASLPEYCEGRLTIEICKRLDELVDRIAANQRPEVTMLRSELEAASASLCQRYRKEVEQYPKASLSPSPAH